MDTFKWHKQSEEDILFAIDDQAYHICVYDERWQTCKIQWFMR